MLNASCVVGTVSTLPAGAASASSRTSSAVVWVRYSLIPSPTASRLIARLTR